MGIVGNPIFITSSAGLIALHNSIRSICYNMLTGLSIPMKFDNEPKKFATSGLRCRVHIDTQDNSKVALGVEQYRYQGDVLLNIFDDLERGDKRILTAVGSMVRTFQTGSTGNVIFQSPRINILGIVDANYQVNLEVPFKSEQYE